MSIYGVGIDQWRDSEIIARDGDRGPEQHLATPLDLIEPLLNALHFHTGYFRSRTPDLDLTIEVNQTLRGDVLVIQRLDRKVVGELFVPKEWIQSLIRVLSEAGGSRN